MNVTLPPPIWTTGSTEVIKTGTWRSALPHYIRPPSPCHQACPVNGDIAEWIGLAGARDFRGAWDVLTRHNPFPSVAGRICHHPCEAACNRGAYDESLAICKLERAVGDTALAEGWAFDRPALERKEHVAIVGGGPAGLSAAFQLRRRGWRVTLHDSQPELGGLMRHGIPPYRLARKVLDGEVNRILALGVQVRHETLAGAQDFERIAAVHDATFIAIGAARPKRLPQLPAQASWWMDGAQYLARSNAGDPPPLGSRLVVVGGGSAAMDVARSARRAGHKVTLLALEQAAQMPAQREELAEALEEGVTLADGAMLRVVDVGPCDVLTLHCVRVRFEAGAIRGQFTVVPLEGGEFTLDADAIVSAIGQDPELGAQSSWLPMDANLLSVDRRQATPAARVWAGGDVASMARFVTEAIGMGKRAALDIDRVLRDEQAPASGGEAPETAVRLAGISTWYHPNAARADELRRPVAERLGGGIEVQLGLDVEQALAEAGRCFSCGLCTNCDNCFQLCPDLAIERVDGGYAVLTDYCKGCGICVRECPTGSMTMREEVR